MNKVIAVVSSIFVASIAGVSGVSAQSFSPVSSNWQATGILSLQQTLSSPILCNAVVDISVDSVGNASVTSVTFPGGIDPLCGTIVRPISPPPATPLNIVLASPPNGDVNFAVVVDAFAGVCNGSFTPALVFDSGLKTIEAVAGTKVPGYVKPGPLPLADCNVEGVLDVAWVSGTTGTLQIVP